MTKNAASIRHILAEGLASWLEFERHCGREGLFSERYLALPVAQILAAQHLGVVHAEHNHPVLSSAGKPGRPPQLDFVIEKSGQVSLVVETKWIATRRITAAEVVWDCIRLELAARHYACEALFVIAGRHDRVEEVLSSEPFNPPTGKHKPSPLLGVNGNGRSSLNVYSPKKAFGPGLHRILGQYSTTDFPHSFICGTGVQLPRQPRQSGYSATVWQVRSEMPAKRYTFRVPGAGA